LNLHTHPVFGSLFHNQHPINTTTHCYILKDPIKEYCFDIWFVSKLLTVVELLNFELACQAGNLVEKTPVAPVLFSTGNRALGAARHTNCECCLSSANEFEYL